MADDMNGSDWLRGAVTAARAKRSKLARRETDDGGAEDFDTRLRRAIEAGQARMRHIPRGIKVPSKYLGGS
jgi:hypothetical protein